MDNPFRIAGTIARPYFTDRETEVARMVAVLREPQAKLVVYGPRRMGKSSAMEIAAHIAQTRHKIPVIAADVSTASGEADIATRILQSALHVLGKKWQDTLKSFATRLSAELKVSADPVTGMPTIAVEPALREATDTEQGAKLGEVLDTIDALAAQRGTTVGIMLDEFQEIHRYGGEQAEWHLRGIIQKHKHIAYILAGSRESLITAMIGERNRAFYELAERLYMGPIDAEHMATWIDERFEGADVQADGIGDAVIAAAGSRTRDRVRLARTAYTLSAPRGKATVHDVRVAMDTIAEEMAPEYLNLWRGLSSIQQNVLRAIAVGTTGLFKTATRERFGIGKTSGATAKAVARLVELELLTRADEGKDYVFDSPFFARWVSTQTLGDIGIPAD